MARADVTSGVSPVADTFVSSANPDANFGNAGALSVAASGLPKGEFRSFVRFDTASLKTSFDSAFGAGNWTIQSATLRLGSAPPNNPIFNGNGAGPGGSNVNTAGAVAASWIADDAWIEGNGTTGGANTVVGAATFNAPPNTSGAESLGTLNFPGGTSGTNTYNLVLSAGMLADLSAGSLLSIQLVSGDSSIAYAFNSRTGGSAPLLSVVAVPEPGGPLMLGLCGMVLAAIIRRHALHAVRSIPGADARRKGR
jgi:hypothetical protein